MVKIYLFMKAFPSYVLSSEDTQSVKIIPLNLWVELIYEYTRLSSSSGTIRDMLQHYFTGSLILRQKKESIKDKWNGIDIYSEGATPTPERELRNRDRVILSPRYNKERYESAILHDSNIYDRATTWYLFEEDTCIARVTLLHSQKKALRLVAGFVEPKKVFEVTAKFHKWLINTYGLEETYFILPKEGTTCLGEEPNWAEAITDDLGEYTKYTLK